MVIIGQNFFFSSLRTRVGRILGDRIQKASDRSNEPHGSRVHRQARNVSKYLTQGEN